jgi:hypothetical protein
MRHHLSLRITIAYTPNGGTQARHVSNSAVRSR